jgi:arylsulfatase A
MCWLSEVLTSRMKECFHIAIILILSFVLISFISGTGKGENEPSLPNVIFILADDLGIGDLGCYGQQNFQTPNIDNLAKEGIKFLNHYTGAPVCAPSRCTLITGKHTGHAAIRQNRSQIGEGRVSLTKDDFTIGLLAKEAGYKTAAFGKWGVGEDGTDGVPNKCGFDEYFGYLNNDHCEFYYTDYLYENLDTFWIEANQNEKTGKYTHDLFTAKAKKFVKANKNNPFFLYLPYTIPHDLYLVPNEDRKPFDGKLISDGKTEFDSVRSIYAGMITRMDRHVGEIMELLKEAGIDENTLVLFSSDNGAVGTDVFGGDYFKSHLNYKGNKGDLNEGGIRTPLIARWPGKIKAGTTTDHISAFWDFMPTLAEIAGVNCPETDGISYLPSLLGKPDQENHQYLYWEYSRKGVAKQAVRIGDLKVLRNNGIKSPAEVYNLKTDPGETKNIANKCPDVVSNGLKNFKEAHIDNRHYPINKQKEDAFN